MYICMCTCIYMYTVPLTRIFVKVHYSVSISIKRYTSIANCILNALRRGLVTLYIVSTTLCV